MAFGIYATASPVRGPLTPARADPPPGRGQPACCAWNRWTTAACCRQTSSSNGTSSSWTPPGPTPSRPWPSPATRPSCTRPSTTRSTPSTGRSSRYFARRPRLARRLARGGGRPGGPRHAGGPVPRPAGTFDAALAADLVGIPPGRARQGIAVGHDVAQQILGWRSTDGSDATVAVHAGDRPGRLAADPARLPAGAGPAVGRRHAVRDAQRLAVPPAAAARA